MLIDTFGRVATDLGVSLTDRCNLRCTYCMPEEGLRWLDKPDLLTDDEIVRLVGIVERCVALEPRPKMSLTTNGIGLRRTAQALKDGRASRMIGDGAVHPQVDSGCDEICC